jgi:transcriptional regulator with XRE-family HTH domain
MMAAALSNGEHRFTNLCESCGNLRVLATDGAKIRRERQLAGLTIRILAAKTGISESRLSAIENGRGGSLRPPSLKAVADALELTVADLVMQPEQTLAA